MLKASLALQHQIIPPNMLFSELSPKVAPFTSNLVVPTKPVHWPLVSPGCPRRASVNSFGFGGTNAHAILESYDKPIHDPLVAGTTQPSQSDGLVPFVFSAHTDKCLIDKISSYSDFLDMNPTIRMLDLAWNLNSRREAFPFKKSFSASSVENLRSGMKASLEELKGSPESSFGTYAMRSGSLENTVKILGIFTGQGAQWARMGVELLESSKVFSRSINRLEKALGELPDAPQWSLRQELERTEKDSRIGEAALSQPLCTAVQVGLVDVLRTTGISMHTVVGHSSGEIAATYAAGFISAADAIRIAYYRGLHSAEAAGHTGQEGLMMAVGLSFDAGQEICHHPQFAGRVAVAASNAPTSVTLSGDADAINEIKTLLDTEKTFARVLHVDKAYHSHHMQACAKPYLLSLQSCDIRPQKPTQSVWVSSVYPEINVNSHNIGSLADTYWIENLINPVLLSQAIEQAVASCGPFDLALEVGPHSALKGPVTQMIRSLTGNTIPYQSCLGRDQNDTIAFSECLGSVWEKFGPSVIDLSRFTRSLVAEADQPTAEPQILKNLPPYNWDHDHSYWKESRISKNLRHRDAPVHELLGVRSFHDLDPYELRWRNILRLAEVPWLRGHRFQNQVLFPGAGYAALALEASKTLFNGRPVKLLEIEDLQIFKAITLDEDGPGTEIISSLNLINRPNHDADKAAADFSCYSCHDEKKDALQHSASCRIYVTFGNPSDDTLPSKVSWLAEPSKIPITTENFYDSLLDIGLQYTDMFRTIDKISRRGHKATASTPKPSGSGLMVHPALLDVCFQTVIAALCFPGDGTLWTTYLPVRIERLRVNPMLCERHTQKVDIHAQIIEGSSKTLSGDMEAFGSDGKLEIQLEGLSCVSFSKPTPENDRSLFSETCWDNDISTSLANELKVSQPDHSEEVELVDALERASYFYLRTLHEKFSKDETTSFEWWYQRIFEFADYFLPLAAKGDTLILRKEWLNDTEKEIDAITMKYTNQIDMRLIRAVGKALPSFVTGKQPLLSVMLEDDMLGALYKEGLGASRVNAMVSRVVKQIAHRHPNMRILEIGGGTGGTTKSVLEVLDGKCAYTFSDISTGFFEKTKQGLGGLADKRVTFKALDIEKDPATQGFMEGSFDLIIAANVLHATRKLSETIANVRSLLRPGGYLILNEVTGDLLRMKLIMSGLPGWWAGGSDGRRYTPSVSMDRWDSILKEGGFSGVDHSQNDFNEPSKRTYSLIVSQAVDEIVDFIRKPLENSFMAPDVEDLIVAGGNSLETASFVENIRQYLNDWNSEATYVKTLDSLDFDSVNDSFTLLCMTELDQPVLKGLTSQQLNRLGQLFNRAKNILWVNSSISEDGPYATAMLGLGRTMLMECPQLNLQMLDVLDYQQADCAMIVDALLRLVSTDILDSTYLWTNEPELSLQESTIMIPRLVPNVPLNNQLNSTRRDISESIPFQGTPIEYQITSDGQPLLYKIKSESPVSEVNDGYLDINVRFSSPYALNICGNLYLFVCLGTLSGTENPVMAFSESNKSIIRVRREWTYMCDTQIVGSERHFLRSVVEQIIAQNLLSGIAVGDAVLFHKLEAQLASVIIQHGYEIGVRVLCTTDEADKANPVTIPYIFVHEFDSVGKIKPRLPLGIKKFVDCSGSTTREILVRDVVNQIVASLPNSCSMHNLATIFDRATRVKSGSTNHEVQKALHWAYSRSLLSSRTSEAVTSIISLETRDFWEAGRTNGHTYVIDWMAQEQVQVRVPPLDTESMFSPKKTYILFGLSGELGRSLAEWMVAKGVKYLVLTSRNPAVENEWIDEQSKGGATIKVFANDITNKQAVKDLRDHIVKTMPPVGGVANGAMVLRDGLFQNMDLEAWETAIKPKIDGSKYLDELFPSPDLEFFVMFSSAASVVGNAGQSNYSAGCMFMAGLAEHRRKRGLPASVIQIGMIVGIGYVARTRLADKSLLANAFNPISEPLYHQIFAAAIIHGRPDSGCKSLLTTGLHKTELTALWSDNPRFSHFIYQYQHDGSSDLTREVVASIPVRMQLESTMSFDEAVSVLIECFRIKLALVLQSPLEKITPTRQLIDLGIDSLIAVDIRTWFLKEVNVDVPVLKVLGGDSISEICREAIGKLTWTLPWTSSAQVLTFQDSAVQKATAQSSIESESSKSESDQEISSVTTPPSETLDMLNSGKHIGNASSRWGDMSPAQARIFLASNILEDPSTYNVAMAWRLSGAFDVNRFENALRVVTQRHESLRTQYYADEETGQPMQHVLKVSKVIMEQKQLVDESTVTGEFERLRNHEFDIGEGETMRVEILFTSQSCFLMLCYHHIIMDQFSLNIMLNDLTKAYAADLLSMDETTQYLDFTKSQKRSIENGDLQNDIAFWKKQYPDEPPELPLFPFALVESRESLRRYDTFTIGAWMDEELIQQIKHVSWQLKSTPFHFYAAALQVLIFQTLEGTTKDLSIGIADSNRLNHDHIDTVGFFVNILPVRASLSATDSFADTMANARTSIYSSLAHSSVSFDVLVESLALPRSATGSPLFEVLLSYTPGMQKQSMLGDVGMEMIEVADAQGAWDLQVTITEAVAFSAQKYMYRESDIQRMMDRYVELLDLFSKNPSALVG